MNVKKCLCLIILIVLSASVLGQVPPLSSGPNPVPGSASSTAGTTSASIPPASPFAELAIGVDGLSITRSAHAQSIDMGESSINTYTYTIHDQYFDQDIVVFQNQNQLYELYSDGSTEQIQDHILKDDIGTNRYYVDITGNVITVTQRDNDMFGSISTVTQTLKEGKTTYEVHIGTKVMPFGEVVPVVSGNTFQEFWNANHNAVKIYIDGQEVLGVSTDSKSFSLKDGSTFYVLENGATARISKEGELRYTDASGAAAVVEKDELKKIFGLKETEKVDLNAAQLSTFLSIAPIAKNYGFDISDLRTTDDGNFIIDGEKDIYFSNDGKTVYKGEGIVDSDGNLVVGVSKTTIIFENGRIISAQIPYDDNGVSYVSSVEYRYNADGTFKGFTIDSKNYDLDPSMPGYAILEGGNERFSLERGSIEKKDANGKWVECDDPSCQELRKKIEAALDEKYQAEGKPTTDARKVQAIFKTIDFALTGFQGLQGFSQIFFSEEFLNEWRETVDEWFSRLYLGTGYWTSEICSTSTETDGVNVAFLNPGPNGYLFPAAHIEVERSSSIAAITPDGQSVTKYLYKVAFSVLNPNDKPDLEINVKLTGDRTVFLYSSDLSVKEGKSLSRSGPTAIVQYSEFLYRKACLTFDPSIYTSNGQISELCTTIAQSSTPSSSFAGSPGPSQTQGSTNAEPTLNQI